MFFRFYLHALCSLTSIRVLTWPVVDYEYWYCFGVIEGYLSFRWEYNPYEPGNKGGP